jgi:hypothetical protein
LKEKKKLLLVHKIKASIFKLGHICHQGQKPSIFKFVGAKTKQKNLHGLKPKYYIFTGTKIIKITS